MVFPETQAIDLLNASHVIFLSPSQSPLPLGKPLGHSACSQGSACSRSSTAGEMRTKSLVHPVKQSASTHYKADDSCHCLRLLPAVFHLQDVERRLPAPKMNKLETEPRASSWVYMLSLYGPMSLWPLLIKPHQSESGEQTSDTRAPWCSLRPALLLHFRDLPQ